MPCARCGVAGSEAHVGDSTQQRRSAFALIALVDKSRLSAHDALVEADRFSKGGNPLHQRSIFGRSRSHCHSRTTAAGLFAAVIVS